MRYVWIISILLMMTGCGGNSTDTPPASPQTHDSGKSPPQVPVID